MVVNRIDPWLSVKQHFLYFNYVDENLLLQKPSKNSKSKDHKVALERRFKP